MAGFNKVVVASYEGERDAEFEEIIGSFRMVFAIETYVEKYCIEVAFGKFQACHCESGSRAGNAVTGLPDYFPNQHRNWKLVLHDENARGAVVTVRRDAMFGHWSPGATVRGLTAASADFASFHRNAPAEPKFHWPAPY